MQFKDYYQVLGVESGAGDAELRTAYRRQARKHHPDVNKEPGSEDKFKAVNEAYEVLRDPDKRRAYDQLRARGYRPGDEVRQPGAGHRGGRGADFDIDEIFAGGGAGGGFSDFFEELFGRRRSAGFSQRPHPGAAPQAQRAKLAVPLEAVYNGSGVRIAVNGRSLEVKVPKGIRPGQSIRLGGQGAGGSDLLLTVEYAAHPRFEVDGRNVIHVLPIAPWEAALGATISVPTLGGAVDVKIPAESEAGRKLRLRRRGLPGTGGDAAGDQMVELEILAPRARDERQRAAYRDLQSSFGDGWRRG